ncbi:MAG TPA: hypothetical protein VGN72_14720 [Tepidisphaeraceae bacterium]|jgi:hypothetical protein|nr:hypothetical protein [Tepidisphaeraceae bacterium]
MTWQNPQQQNQHEPPTQWQQSYGGYPDYGAPVNRPHSKFGIASFIIGLVSIVAMIALFVIAAVIAMNADGEIDETSPEAIAIGLGLFGGIALALVGLIFSIVGLVNANAAKVFSVLGLIFNGLIILGVIGLMVLGAFIG